MEKNIYYEFADEIGDVADYKRDQQAEIKLFNELSVVDGFSEYLKYLIAEDMKRYFAATDDIQRATVRGAMARNSSLLYKLSGKFLNKVL